jgi:hypothetical protein
MDRIVRCLAWSFLALIPLSVIEVRLGITQETLGVVRYHAYMISSTLVVMAIVWRMLRPRPPVS